MEKQRPFSQSILRVALVTGLILTAPMLGMMFSDQVNWGLGDFVVMGAIIFCTGLAYVALIRLANSLAARIAVTLALGTTFFMVWANLAVGLIGSGPNPGNLMYLGVLAVGFIGAVLSHFTTRGMERTMYAMASAVALLAIIALLFNMQSYPGSSILEILSVNALFVVLFGLAGLLFRYVGMMQSHQQQNSGG